MTSRRAPTRETPILQAIREALGREPDITLWRNSTGVLADASGRHVRFGLCVGSSDLIGILAPLGMLVAIEVKRPKGGRASAEQAQFIDLVKRRGGHGGFARSVEDARRIVDEARAIARVRLGAEVVEPLWR